MAFAQQPDTTRVSYSAFIDTYYAYDLNRPRIRERSFHTTASTRNELDVNLAFVDVRAVGRRARARVASQLGTSVDANYAVEPGNARYLQEAFAGYRVARDTWIDAGILLAPFGSESWISRENWTYTRSLIADNSPYYESGVRLTWTASPHVTAQAHVMNGWQNIAENNGSKALGLRVDVTPSARMLLAYDAFIGNEQPDTAPPATRFFHELIARIPLGRRLDASATLDYGRQRLPAQQRTGEWRGWVALVRARVSEIVAMTARAEGYSDPDQIIVTAARMRATGASLTADVAPNRSLLWRVEARLLRSPAPLFETRTSPGLSSREWCVITSLAIRVGGSS